MTTVAFVGKSRTRKPAQAGREAAEAALAGIAPHKPNIVFVFATAGYDQQTLLDAVRAVVPDVPMAGCSGEGIITSHGSDEGTHAVAVMAIASDKATFDVFHLEDFSKDFVASGEAIAARVAAAGPERAKAVFVFPDGLTGNATGMLAALKRKLPFPVLVSGGTAGDMMKLEATYQYHDGVARRDSVTAVILGGDVEVDYVVSHGCTPVGLERTVTRSDGARVFEIDGKPAWSVFKEYLDGDPVDLSAADVVHLCVGERLASTAAQAYGDHIIRTPLALDPATGMLFFPGGLAEGAKIQMTRRDPDRMRESAVASARTLAERHRGDNPFALFQFDCAGRGKVIFGDKASENMVSPLQQVFGGAVPWLGFHTFGEIAELGGTPYFHNYSVVLCALYERA